MLRTVVNVTGDATVATLISKNMDKLSVPQERTWDEKYQK
jgi:Na+/H+-dicarboxylate symporter